MAHADQDPATPSENPTESVRAVTTALYRSVSFDRGEPDWKLFRSLVIPEAVFIQAARGPRPMRAMTIDEFVQDFRSFVAERELADVGFHETVVNQQITSFDNIAHAFVVFEPRLGSDRNRRRRRGLDSIQLVKTEGRWQIASITTEFESEGRPIPDRFLDRKDKQASLGQQRISEALRLEKKTETVPTKAKAPPRIEVPRKVDLDTLKEGVTTRAEILSLLGTPEATRTDRLIYDIWRKPGGRWQLGIPWTHFDPRYSEWTPEKGKLRLLFDRGGILARKELPGDS